LPSCSVDSLHASLLLFAAVVMTKWCSCGIGGAIELDAVQGRRFGAFQSGASALELESRSSRLARNWQPCQSMAAHKPSPSQGQRRVVTRPLSPLRLYLRCVCAAQHCHRAAQYAASVRTPVCVVCLAWLDPSSLPFLVSLKFCRRLPLLISPCAAVVHRALRMSDSLSRQSGRYTAQRCNCRLSRVHTNMCTGEYLLSRGLRGFLTALPP
jgi:hypothetical protein